MEPFLAEVRIFPFGFAPKGWASCNGQLLPKAQNQALFALLQYRYGGNGSTTFALPDLRGRAPMHPGQGPGLTQRTLGQSGGQATVTLTTAQIPSHTHPGTVHLARDGEAVSARPTRAMPGVNRAEMYTNTPGPVAQVIGVGSLGEVAAHENRMPFLPLNFCIALQGVFPSRS